MMPMDNPQKVTAYLKVTAEFYDPEATPETVRACVEQDLEDAGYDVEVVPLDKGNNVLNNWIPVKDRLPDAAGAPVLVTAVNRFNQNAVFIAFQGYGDFKWYTCDVTKMTRDGSTNNEVGSGWTITHWMEMPEPAEEP